MCSNQFKIIKWDYIDYMFSNNHIDWLSQPVSPWKVHLSAKIEGFHEAQKSPLEGNWSLRLREKQHLMLIINQVYLIMEWEGHDLKATVSSCFSEELEHKD